MVLLSDEPQILQPFSENGETQAEAGKRIQRVRKEREKEQDMVSQAGTSLY